MYGSMESSLGLLLTLTDRCSKISCNSEVISLLSDSHSALKLCNWNWWINPSESASSSSITPGRFRLAASLLALVTLESRLTTLRCLTATLKGLGHSLLFVVTTSDGWWKTFLRRVNAFLKCRWMRTIRPGRSDDVAASADTVGWTMISSTVSDDVLFRLVISALRFNHNSSWIESGSMTDWVGLKSTFIFGKPISGK